MPWFKVDDKLHDHRKARSAGTTAMGLWVLAGSWAADNLTNGFVPDSICARWDRSYVRLAARLVEVGFWAPAEQDGETGWRFHEWSQRQPTREQIEARREAARERMAKLRDGSLIVRANIGRSNAEVLVPVPSLPNPTQEQDSVGGERLETLQAVPATTPPNKRSRCAKHPNGNPTNENCRGCKADREWDEREAERERAAAEHLAEKAVRARRAEADACPKCHGSNWVEIEAGKPLVKCREPHTQLALIVGLGGV